MYPSAASPRLDPNRPHIVRPMSARNRCEEPTCPNRVGREKGRKGERIQRGVGGRPQIVDKFERVFDVRAGTEPSHVPSDKSLEVISERRLVNCNITLHVFHDAEILVRHVSRIDDIYEHERLLAGSPDQDVARLMIRPWIDEVDGLATYPQRVAIAER